MPKSKEKEDMKRKDKKQSSKAGETEVVECPFIYHYYNNAFQTVCILVVFQSASSYICMHEYMSACVSSFTSHYSMLSDHF